MDNFSNRIPLPPAEMAADFERMPENPQRGVFYHRRAHSDTSFRLPNLHDLLLFDPADLDLSVLSSPTDGVPMAVDSSNSKSSDDTSGPTPRPNLSAHFRSFSVDSDFFDGVSLGGDGSGNVVEVVEKKPKAHHRHSNSMDGSSLASFDEVDLTDSMKKAMGPDRVAELALIDPKRAKRILANRQSAARSKERKVRYTNELERKVQTLQSEATTLSAQVTILQRDTSGLTVENKELKLVLQAMEQQAQLRDALHDALREEVQHLKIATGQIPAVNGCSAFNRGLPPQFPGGQALAQPVVHHFCSAPMRQHQQQLQKPPHSSGERPTRPN